MSFREYRIFDQMLEGVQIVKPDGTYVYVNDAVVKHSKFSREELLNSSMLELYPGIGTSDMFDRIQKCYYQRKPQELVNEFDFPDGSKGYFQLRMEPTGEGILIMSYDVTDQKRAEKLIEANTQYLEEIIRTRTTELQDQNVLIEKQLEDLKKLNTTKDKFFSIIAHDLMSPLNSLKGLSSVLAMGIEKFEKHEINRISFKLQESVDQTIKLAENLITWSRSQMQAPETNFEDIDVSSLLHDIHHLYKQLAEKKGIKLHLDISTGLKGFGDKNQISFILRNLINNAIKYTHQSGNVKISVLEVPDKGQLMVTISDNGMGMPEELAQNIHSLKAVKSRDGSSGEKGTGLGLILCFEFIALNEGTIECHSKKGAGTTFNVFIKAKHN